MGVQIKDSKIIFEEGPKILLADLSEKPTDQMAEAKTGDYISLLASKLPAPGGGAASALCGAQGYALASMVCNFTIGKKKFEEHFVRLEHLLRECSANAKRMLDLMDLDEENFIPLSKAYGIKATTEEEKREKEIIMNEALGTACLAPLEMMHNAYEGLTLLEELMEISSVMVVSDVGVAAENFRCAIEGAKLNVMINAKTLTDLKLKQEMEDLIKEKTVLSERTYKKVMDNVYSKL